MSLKRYPPVPQARRRSRRTHPTLRKTANARELARRRYISRP